MHPGKVPPDILSRIIFKHLGKEDPDVILGPGLGQDASVLGVGEKVIVAATDPITGSVEDVGWLAVHVNANDIATFGVRPRWFLASLMLPVGCDEKQIEHIVGQINRAANSLGIAVVGGHSEITEGIDRPIVAGFMLGVADDGEFVTSSGARPGDAIVLTKSIGIEGTSILASEGKEKLERLLGEKLVEQALSLRNEISVVAEGLAAFKTGHVTAMHDPTEGGIYNGLHELCDASSVGFEIDTSAMAIDEATQRICETLAVNPMELISSGCMILTCSDSHANQVVDAIERTGVAATRIGSIHPEATHRRTTQGVDVPRPETDVLWTALKRVKSL
ncbi:hydrogenase [Candidatus Thorarchaeota archaeon]|nr:MAG: hydrogenase [Candidatus Thorarchaeota archaeon]